MGKASIQFISNKNFWAGHLVVFMLLFGACGEDEGDTILCDGTLDCPADHTCIDDRCQQNEPVTEPIRPPETCPPCPECLSCDMPPRPPEPSVVLIQDETTDKSSCTSTAPGVDISAVGLYDSDGRAKAWGRLAVWEVVEESNEYALGVNINGEAPESITECPPVNRESLLSLGCGGMIAVEFQTPQFHPVFVEDGDRVVIYERGGARCGGETPAERYSAWLCLERREVLDSHRLESCSVQLAQSASGMTIKTFDVESVATR